MQILAMICNIALFGFTGLVLATDGLPQRAAYVVFTLLTLLVPFLSATVLFRSAMGRMMKIVAIISNIILLGFTAWAIVTQYPHPEEEGVIAFTVLLVLTPSISLAALLRSRGTVKSK